MGRVGTVTIASARMCTMGCRCTGTTRLDPSDPGPSVYLAWVLLSAGLLLAAPSIAIAQASGGTDELAEARRMNQEATALYSSGKFPEAIALVQRALAIQEKALGPEHLAVASADDRRGGPHRGDGEDRETVEAH